MSTKTLILQHSSGFVFDSTRNQLEDAKKIFSTGAHVMSGTEAGPGAKEYDQALRAAARKNGYLFFRPNPQDCWVAIHKDLRVPGTVIKKGCPIILPRGRSVGDPHPYSAKGVPWLQVVTPFGGLPLTMTGGHWLTKGRWPGQAQEDKPHDPVDHYAANTKMAHRTAKLCERKIQNGGWAFNGSDTNLIDRTKDVFRGGDMVTCWDEVKSWPNTGHGNIDVLARHGKCKAKFKSARTMPELDLNSDHLPITAKVLLTY